MIALDNGDPVFNATARAAKVFESFSQRLEIFLFSNEMLYQRHRFAATMFCIEPDP